MFRVMNAVFSLENEKNPDVLFSLLNVVLLTVGREIRIIQTKQKEELNPLFAMHLGIFRQK